MNDGRTTIPSYILLDYEPGCDRFDRHSVIVGGYEGDQSPEGFDGYTFEPHPNIFEFTFEVDDYEELTEQLFSRFGLVRLVSIGEERWSVETDEEILGTVIATTSAVCKPTPADLEAEVGGTPLNYKTRESGHLANSRTPLYPPLKSWQFAMYREVFRWE